MKNMKKLGNVVKSLSKCIVVLILYMVIFVTSVTRTSPVVFMVSGDILKLYFILLILYGTAVRPIKQGFDHVLIYILNINI